MTTGEDFLKEKGWDASNTSVGGALFTGFAQLLDEYRLKILEDVKIGFDIYSDHSTMCLGYRNLIDRIRREKENKPIDKSISPIKKNTNI